MTKNSKKKTKVLIVIGGLMVLCIVLLVCKKITISGIERGANNCSVSEIKLNELLGFDTDSKPEVNYYLAESVETFNEQTGMYEYTHTEKEAIQSLVYSGGNFIKISAKEILYFFDEQEQKCNGMAYLIDSENREEFIEVVKKEIGEEGGNENMKVDKETYIFSWTDLGDEIKIRIEFK